ncbi:Nephrocystin-3 [Trichoplax sp. H2]|nr:Nephrocystin-3 [Trichoplax sp. H2]|eukprot:RDD37135.1 Nephrocystin-3 [Trichoplax sp. H2]
MDETVNQSVSCTVIKAIQSLYQKGQKYYNSYNHQQALSCYIKTLDQIQTVSKPGKDLQQLQCEIYLHISNIYLRQCELVKADEFSQKMQELAVKIQDQVRIAQYLDIQGDIKKSNHNENGALCDYTKSLEIKLQDSEDDNLHVANSYTKIGNIFAHWSKFDDALCKFEKALKIRLNVLGDNHPDVAMSYSNIGSIYHKQHKFDEAFSLYEKSLRLKLEAFGNNHPDVAAIYNNMARICASQTKHDNALSLYEKSLQILTQILGDHHPRVADSYYNMGIVYRLRGMFDEALSMYEKSLKIRLDIFGESHTDVATLYQNIANIYYYKNQFEKASIMDQKAITIISAILGSNHPQIATLYDNLEKSYLRLRRYTDVDAVRNKSKNIRRHFKKDIDANQQFRYHPAPIREVRDYFDPIASSIGTDWTKLAVKLDSNIDIDKIKNENPNQAFHQTMDFLNIWYKKNYPDVSHYQLQRALRQIARDDIAIKIGNPGRGKNYRSTVCVLL